MQGAISKEIVPNPNSGMIEVYNRAAVLGPRKMLIGQTLEAVAQKFPPGVVEVDTHAEVAIIVVKPIEPNGRTTLFYMYNMATKAGTLRLPTSIVAGDVIPFHNRRFI